MQQGHGVLSPGEAEAEPVPVLDHFPRLFSVAEWSQPNRTRNSTAVMRGDKLSFFRQDSDPFHVLFRKWIVQDKKVAFHGCWFGVVGDKCISAKEAVVSSSSNHHDSSPDRHEEGCGTPLCGVGRTMLCLLHFGRTTKGRHLRSLEAVLSEQERPTRPSSLKNTHAEGSHLQKYCILVHVSKACR